MARRRTATLQDVADLCGVSRGTASRALTGDGRVAAETRTRVMAAASELNYATNSGARNLRRARAGSIGVWLPRGLHFTEYYMMFAFGVAESVRDKELTVSLISDEYPAARAHTLHVDGFVMADVDGADDLARAILSAGVPVVASERVPASLPQPDITVAADHAGITRSLLDRLRAGGSRSIAVLTVHGDQTWSEESNRASARWSQDTGVPLVLHLLDGVPSATALHDVVEAMLEASPDLDGILCLPQGLAVGILSNLRELGRAVPEDIQIVAYNDSPTLPLVQPPISAMDLRPRDAGSRAGELLIALIEGPHDRVEPRLEPFDVVFHDRESLRPR